MVCASRLGRQSCYCPNHAKLWRRDAFGPTELFLIDLKMWPAVEEERRSQSRSRFNTNRVKVRHLFPEESKTAKVPDSSPKRCVYAGFPGCWTGYPQVSSGSPEEHERSSKTNLQGGEGEGERQGIFNASPAHFAICRFS